MIKCQECGLIFENAKIKANHVRWKHRKPYTEEGAKKNSDKAKIRNERKYGKLIEEKVHCAKCDKAIIIEHRDFKKEKYFCSDFCAHSRDMIGVITETGRKSISDKMKVVWTNPEYVKNQLAKNKFKFTSKREVEIRDYFIKNFPNDSWSSGGGLILPDGSHLSRDLYSNKLKVCFEYDGIWHFKNIKGQLAKKQYKDKLLEEWCINKGYKLVRVDSETNITIDEIQNLIYKDSRPIIKVGTRY